MVCVVHVLFTGDIFRKNHRKKSVTKGNVFKQNPDGIHATPGYHPSSVAPFIFVNPPVTEDSSNHSLSTFPSSATEELQVTARQEGTAESVARYVASYYR